MTDEPVADREFTIVRDFDAPARLLFEAYSRPEHIKRWFGPVGWPVTLCEMDFRVGGRFRFAMTGPSGEQNTPFGGEYLELVPNERIVHTDAFDDGPPGTMKTTITLKEVMVGTEVNIVQEGVPDAIPAEAASPGGPELFVDGLLRDPELLGDGCGRMAGLTGRPEVGGD